MEHSKENCVRPAQRRNPLQLLKVNETAVSSQLAGRIDTHIRKPLGVKNFQTDSHDNLKTSKENVKVLGQSNKPFEIFCDVEQPQKSAALTSKCNVPTKPSFSVYRDADDKEDQEDNPMLVAGPSSLKRENYTKSQDVFKSAEHSPMAGLMNYDTFSRDREVEELEVNSTVAFDSIEEDSIETSLIEGDQAESTESPIVFPASETVVIDAEVTEYLKEYSESMFRYLLSVEARVRPRYNYMTKQPDITHSMRSILVDWLVEVAQEYKLEQETLYLSISYIDRFLSIMSVLRGKLQLVGTASMFIASKYEEIYPPDLSEFVYITDDTYSKQQVLRMEHLILKALSFDLSSPTINYFLDRLLYLSEAPPRIKNLARYLCEQTLTDGECFLRYVPSEIAASSVVLANFTFGREPWNSKMEKESGYMITELDDCLVSLHQMFLNASQSQYQAIRDKYKTPKYNAVSLMTPPPLTYVRRQ